MIVSHPCEVKAGALIALAAPFHVDLRCVDHCRGAFQAFAGFWQRRRFYRIWSRCGPIDPIDIILVAREGGQVKLARPVVSVLGLGDTYFLLLLNASGACLTTADSASDFVQVCARRFRPPYVLPLCRVQRNHRRLELVYAVSWMPPARTVAFGVPLRPYTKGKCSQLIVTSYSRTFGSWLRSWRVTR